MPRTSVNFDSDTVGGSPNPELWDQSPHGLGAQGLTVTSPPIVRRDSFGKHLGPGLPVLGKAKLLPTSRIGRVEVIGDVPAVPANSLATILRLIMPISAALAPGPSSSGFTAYDPLSAYQYLAVDVRRGKDDGMSLVAYLTDPATSIGGIQLNGAMVARASLNPAIDDEKGRLVVECGPRYLRAWWIRGGDPRINKFKRRVAPTLGAMIPSIEFEDWGVCTQGGKIRSASVVCASGDEDDVALEMIPVPASLSLTAEDGLPDRSTGASRERLAIARHEVPHETKRRRGALIYMLSGPGATGRLADSFCPRLDAAQTLIPVPDGDLTSISVSTFADELCGAASEIVATIVDVDPDDGPAGGIGSGRSSMDDGGEIFFCSPEASQTSQMTLSQQDYASEQGAREAFTQISNRSHRSWGLDINCRPVKHLRRAELAVGAAVMSRPIWIRAPLEGRPISAFITSFSHRIEQVNSCVISASIEET